MLLNSLMHNDNRETMIIPQTIITNKIYNCCIPTCEKWTLFGPVGWPHFSAGRDMMAVGGVIATFYAWCI